MEHAKDRGATVLATVLAAASRFSPTQAIQSGDREPEREPRHSREAAAAIKLAIGAVLEKSGVSTQSIGLVVSHAIGDRQVDLGEAMAFAETGLNCPCVAVSAALGHTGAASGMIELATGVLAIANKTIPPTRHGQVNPHIQFCDAGMPLASPYVLCLTHTTDGSAMAVLLGEPPNE